MSTEYRYDPETGSFRPTQRRQEQSDWGGWALIAFFFLTGLWPLGLFFLISKLNDTPTHRPAAKAANDTKIVKAAKSVTRTPAASDKTAKILTIVGAAITGVFGIGLLSTIGEMLAYGGARHAAGGRAAADGLCGRRRGDLFGRTKDEKAPEPHHALPCGDRRA